MGFWDKLIGRHSYANLTVDELLREAQTAIGKQDVDSALRATLYALQREPTNPMVYMGLGICCYMKRWHANALACFRRVLDFDPYNQEARLNKERIEASLERAHKHMWDLHTALGVKVPAKERTDETLRLSHEMNAEAAYRDLCHGLFKPRI